MIISSINNRNYNLPQYTQKQMLKPSFKGNLRIQSYDEFMRDTTPFKEVSKECVNRIEEIIKRTERENESLFLSRVLPKCKEIMKKIVALPDYDYYLLPFIAEKSKDHLEYLYFLT